ncbi:MAG: hypothetical protein RL026_1977 [Pseudomonadota bacterium]|jgi:NAD(P) transhydrogenase
MEHFDALVIGTGPAGEGAAMMLSKHQRKVAVVERYASVGGGCTHWGTIPSKALRHAVRTVNEARAHPLLRAALQELSIGFPQLLATADAVIANQVQMRQRFYDRNRVPVLRGSARFLDAHRVAITSDAAPDLQVSADHIIIATGSRPYRPPGLDFAHPRIRDSDTILSCRETPFAVTIYGAGVIGCEYASIFLNMGCKVNLVNTQGQLLSFMDEEISEALSYHLRDQGCVIRHGEQFESVEARESDVLLNLKSGRRIKSDLLLWANGRTGNTDGMALEAIGLLPNQRGQLKVNTHYQTDVPHVYAVGDVTGPPALASAAYQQGSDAARHILDAAAQPTSLDLIPSGIYTLPEISSVGRTERELQAAGVPYEIGHMHFKSLARAQMSGQRVGMLKLLFDTRDLKVLGVHCFGENASEIVHIGQAVMSDPAINSLRYFINTTFNYPTMAEAYRIAAHNGLNRLV